MKAKEIAERIRANPGDGTALDAVCDLINDAIALAKLRKQEGSKLAVFRESFQKWRAVCSLLAGGTEGEKAGLSLYPKAMRITSKPLFVACVQGGVFLGYEMDAEDRAVCSEVLHEAQLAEQEALARARFNVLFGAMMQRVFA